MASKVEICNTALHHLGASAISSLDEATKAARECKLLYDNTRKEVLRAHDWSCARKRAYLALLGDTYSGWNFAYKYPNDCVALRKISDETQRDSGLYYPDDIDIAYTEDVHFEIVVNSTLNGKVILTDQENAEAVYTANVEDTNVFDPDFISAFAYLLASKMALPLKGKETLQRGMFSLYEITIGQGKATAANEENKRKKNVSKYVSSR